MRQLVAALAIFFLTAVGGWAAPEAADKPATELSADNAEKKTKSAHEIRQEVRSLSTKMRNIRRQADNRRREVERENKAVKQYMDEIAALNAKIKKIVDADPRIAKLLAEEKDLNEQLKAHYTSLRTLRTQAQAHGRTSRGVRRPSDGPPAMVKPPSAPAPAK